MPVYPFNPLPPAKTGNYQHMSYRDMAVWERFLDQYAGQVDAVAYDVALGGIEADPNDGTPAMRQAWRYSTAIKVDAVAIDGNLAVVIEVKPRAGPSAIGQALCGATLFELDNPAGYEVQPAVVTDAASPDVRYLCERLGVELYEVGYPEIEPTIRAGDAHFGAQE